MAARPGQAVASRGSRGPLNLPADAYYMAGAAGQFRIIVPSLDPVVVRIGRLVAGTDLRLTGIGPRTLNQALTGLTAAVAAGGGNERP